MENLKPKPLSSFIFIPLLSFIFFRPFFSGLAYPILETYCEITLILIAIITLLAFKKPHRLPSSFAKASDDKTTTCEVKYDCIFLLLSAYIISAAHSVNINNSILEILKFLSFASIFFIVSQIDERQKNLLIKTIVIASVIISLYAIYQYFWGYSHTLNYLKKINSDFLRHSSYARDILLDKRAIATFPSPNILGGYLIMIFFLTLHLLSEKKYPAPSTLNLLPNMFFILMIFAALLLTKSLGAWLSLIITMITLFFLSYKSIKHKKAASIAFLIAIFLVIGFILITRWERLMNLDNPQNSIIQRLNYWRTAIAVIKDHPILGVGPGNFQEVFLKYKVGFSTNTRYAHNMLLQTWTETGILGFIALIYLVITFLAKVKSNSRYIFLAGLAFLLHNLIDNTYFIPEVGLFWWVLFGLSKSKANS